MRSSNSSSPHHHSTNRDKAVTQVALFPDVKSSANEIGNQAVNNVNGGIDISHDEEDYNGELASLLVSIYQQNSNSN